MMFDSLKDYKLPEDFAESYDKLKVSIAEVNNDDILNKYMII